jgi:hypothetical protein
MVIEKLRIFVFSSTKFIFQTMKKLFFFLSVLLFAVACEPSVKAQNLTYSFANGNIVVRRSNNVVKALAVIGTSVDTVTITSVRYLRFSNNGTTQLTLAYGASNDSINGRTWVQARNIINQDISGENSNYLGAYTKSELISSDTSIIGYFYYDTDTAAFRVKRAVGGFRTF